MPDLIVTASNQTGLDPRSMTRRSTYSGAKGGGSRACAETRTLLDLVDIDPNTYARLELKLDHGVQLVYDGDNDAVRPDEAGGCICLCLTPDRT